MNNSILHYLLCFSSISVSSGVFFSLSKTGAEVLKYSKPAEQKPPWPPADCRLPDCLTEIEGGREFSTLATTVTVGRNE